MGKVKRFVELLKPRRDAVEDTTPLILRADTNNDVAKDAADRQLMDNIVFHMRSAELGGDRSANNTTSDGCGNGSVSPTPRDVRGEVGGQVDMRRRSQRCTCCQFPRHAKRSDFLYHRLACSCDVDVMITTNQDEAPQTQGVLNERPPEAEQCLVDADDTMCDDTEQGWAEMCKIIGKHIPFRTNYQYVSTPDSETFNTSANNITTGRPSMKERMQNDSNVKSGIPMDGSYDPVNDQQVYRVCLTPNCVKPVMVNCRSVPYASMRSSYGLKSHCMSRCKPKLKGFCRRDKEIRFCPYSSASSQRRQNVRFCRQNSTRNCRWGRVNEASGPPYPYLYRASVRNIPRGYNVSSCGTLGGYVGSQNRIYGDCSAFRKVPGGVIQSSCKFCPRLQCRQQCAGGRYYNEHETCATFGTDRGQGFYPIHVDQSINRCGGPYFLMPTRKIDMEEDAQTFRDVFSKSNVNKSSKGLVPSRKKNKDANFDIEEESVHSNSIAGHNAENTRSFVHDVEGSVFSSKAHVCKCTQVKNTSDVSCATHDFTLEQHTAGVLDKLSETSSQGDIETEDKFTFSLPHTILENGTVKPGLVNGTKDPISSSPVTANIQRDHPATEVPPAENITVSKCSSPKCSYRNWAVKAVSGSNMATDLPDSHPEGNCSNNHDQILLSSNSTPNHYHLYKEQCHICGTMVQRSTPDSANIAANRASFNCCDDLGSDDTNDRLFAGITNTTNGKIHETTNADDNHFNNNSTSSCCHHHGKRKQLSGRVIRVEGDGRCLFRSLVTVSYEALRLTDRDDFGRPEKRKLADLETVLADNLRGTVVAFMKENLKFYSQLENSIINADQPVTSNYKKFLDRLSAMSNPTTMPGDLELNALAAVLEREIIVLDTTLRVITSYGFDKFPLAVPVAVRYTRILPDVGHYDAVVLENQDKTVTPNNCFPTTDHSSETVRKTTPEKSTDKQKDLLEATKKFFEMNPSGQKRNKGQKTTKVHGEARLNAKKEFFYARNSDKIMHSNGILPLHPQHSSVEKMEVEQTGKSLLPVTSAALCTKDVENTENKETMEVGQSVAGTPRSVTRSTQTEGEASDVLIPGESRSELVQRSLTPEEPRYVLVQRSSTPDEPRYMPVQKRSGPGGARRRRKTYYKCLFHSSNGWQRRRVQKEKRITRRRNATTARPVKISRRRSCKFSAVADKNVNWNNRASNGSEKRRRKPLKKGGASDLHRVRKTVPSTASRSCKCKVCKVGHKRPVCLKQSAKRATNTSGNSNSGEKERQLPSKSNEPTSSGRSRPSDQQAKRQRWRPNSRANRSPSASQLPAVGGGLIGDDKFLPNRSPQKPDILPPYLPQRVQVPFKESTVRCPVCNSRVSERTSVKCYICGRMAHRACVMKESLIREDGGGDQRYFMCSVCLSI